MVMQFMERSMHRERERSADDTMHKCIIWRRETSLSLYRKYIYIVCRRPFSEDEVYLPFSLVYGFEP
jgi:hypothetical protein